MANEHTPGPWTWIREGTTLIGADDDQVLAIDLPEFIEDENKALIAAAPDLLAACQAFVTAHDKSLQLEKTDVALRLARAAIAKAEGREPARLIGDLLTHMGL